MNTRLLLQELVYDDVDETELYWVPGGPDVPRGAVTAGDLQDGTPVYVVRTWSSDKYFPALYRTSTDLVEFVKNGTAKTANEDWHYLVLKYSKYSRM